MISACGEASMMLRGEYRGDFVAEELLGWMAGGQSESLGHRARGAVEDITRRRVRYTRTGPRGKIMPEEVGIYLFSPCLLWLRTQVPMIAFVSLRESRKERDVSLEKPSSSSAFEEPRSWSWLKYRHKLRKLRASRIENIVHFEQVYIISFEWKITSSFIL